MNLRGGGGTLKPLQKCGFPPPPLTVLPFESSFPSPLHPYSALLTACKRRNSLAYCCCRSLVIVCYYQSLFAIVSFVRRTLQPLLRTICYCRSSESAWLWGRIVCLIPEACNDRSVILVCTVVLGKGRRALHTLCRRRPTRHRRVSGKATQDALASRPPPRTLYGSRSNCDRTPYYMGATVGAAESVLPKIATN